MPDLHDSRSVWCLSQSTVIFFVSSRGSRSMVNCASWNMDIERIPWPTLLTMTCHAIRSRQPKDHSLFYRDGRNAALVEVSGYNSTSIVTVSSALSRRLMKISARNQQESSNWQSSNMTTRTPERIPPMSPSRATQASPMEVTAEGTSSLCPHHGDKCPSTRNIPQTERTASPETYSTEVAAALWGSEHACNDPRHEERFPRSNSRTVVPLAIDTLSDNLPPSARKRGWRRTRSLARRQHPPSALSL